MTQTKIERLKAIKEEFALTAARLAAARKLEEAAETHSMATLLENDLEQAELVLAAQDIMNKLQNMAEDLAKMNAQDLFPLVDKMKAAFGQESAHSFEESAQQAIADAMQTVRRAKDELGNSIMRLEGKVPPNDMSADAGMDAGASMGDDMGSAEVGSDDVDMAMDDFGAADAASGPEEAPMGRARKESVEGGKALNESIILEAAGRKLIETEGLNSLIAWVLNEAAMGMPEEHFRSFATSIAQKAAENPAKLAGWIGKKKLGDAAVAQLAEPTFTQGSDLEIAEGKFTKALGKAALGAAALASVGSVGAIAKKGYDYHKVAGSSNMSADDYEQEKNFQDAVAQAKANQTNEGKTFRKNDDEDDKAERFAARKNARREKGKGEDALDEGKTFRKNDDEDDKAERFAARKSARREKGKGEDELDEGKTFRKGDDEDDKEERFKARKSARREKQKGEDELEEGKTFRKGDEDEDDKEGRMKSRQAARREKGKGEEKMDEAAFAAKAVAQIIEANVQKTGKGMAAKAVREAIAYLNSQGLNESEGNNEAALLEAFQTAYGMTPAAYSVQLVKEAPLTTQDKKVAGSAMAKIAGKMSTNKSAANQSVQSAMAGMSGQERTVANKMLNNMKQNGENPKNAGEFAQNASAQVGDEDAVNENINAAHWPVDTHGQYKGEPMSTDYGKLKPTTTPKAGKVEGGAKETKVEEPAVDNAKAPATEKKPSGNPFAKKEESTENDDSEK